MCIRDSTRAADKALDQKILDQVFEFFPRLAERKGQMGGTLSGGEQQMLAIGRAMMLSLIHILLEDEGCMGYVHVALGNNETDNQDCLLHIDMMFKDPTIEVDGKVIFDEGKVVFD